MTTIRVDGNQAGRTYPAMWKRLTTAGRAGEGLRAEWREQLRELQREAPFEYMRFHGLFHDEMMIYREDSGGNPIYNWQYFDSLFDFLLSVGIRPLMELGFMPKDLASEEHTQFWWKGYSVPPKDYGKWQDLLRALVRHCIGRYGLHEVRRWYFEVWNEPNLFQIFWWADQAEYFKLYKASAEAIKSVDPELRVGGPATSNFTPEGEAPWLKDFLAWCEETGAPVDFISTHPYPNSWPIDSEGKARQCYHGKDSTPNDIKWIHDVVRASAFPDAEIHLTEWNSSPSPRDLVHDTAFMAPFVIYNNLQSMYHTDSLGFWAFTDIFEEKGLGDTIFHGGFGLINAQGIPKPAYHGYWYLGQLGPRMLDMGDSHAVTRSEDAWQVLVWNYCHYNEKFAKGDPSDLKPLDRYGVFEEQGPERFEIALEGLSGRFRVLTYELDREHGSAFDAWVANGAPANPTPEEVAILKQLARPKAGIAYVEADGALTLSREVAPHGVVLFKVSPA